MKAVILAAGKGTRMGALTEELPKPMLPVEGKPILEHIISGIAAQGVREICLIVGWKSEVIEQHFGDGSALGLNITYTCLLYTSPRKRDVEESRMTSSA